MTDRRTFVRRGSLWLLGAAIVGPEVLERLNWRRKSFPTGIDLRRRTELVTLYGGPRHGRQIALEVDAQGIPRARHLEIPRLIEGGATFAAEGDHLTFIRPSFACDIYHLVPFRVEGKLVMDYEHPASDGLQYVKHV